jgi:hypothetical protein
MITKKQRSTFFLIANQIGRDNAYAVMQSVTGITSLRDERLTKDTMKRVIDELLAASDIEIRRPPKKKKFRKPLDIQRGENVIKLIPYWMRQRIQEYCQKVNFDPGKYRSFCQRIIKRDEPLTMQEGQAIYAALKSMVYKRWKAEP